MVEENRRPVSKLPIDSRLAEAVSLLQQTGRLVLEAEPGAGKTTRLPPALLPAVQGDVVVVEPRRLAARLAARRVAEERGEAVGETVGYSVRFEDVSGPKTRLRFVTPRVLLGQWLQDPMLQRVGAVVLDEFHERSLDGDLLLALLAQLQEGVRPDLRLVVMSATLELGPLTEFLSPCPTLSVPGRTFPLDIEHALRADDRPLESQIASAVRSLLSSKDAGNVLVFLPGAGEIRRAAEKLEPLARAAGIDVLPLHGDLPLEEQARAVRTGPRQKVILSTNVAETSVTVNGVTAVVDCGLARSASVSPWTGLSTLVLKKISKASAAQRAGRAGRTGPGKVLRLYTDSDFQLRPARESPEIERTELSECMLLLASAGASPTSLKWLDAPPPAALEAAKDLLCALAAITEDGAITETGRRLLRLPVHPRLARVIDAADQLGFASSGSLLAALLSERDIWRGARFDPRRHGAATLDAAGPSDLLERRERFLEARDARFADSMLRTLDLDRGAVRAVDLSWKQLERSARRLGDRKSRPKPEQAASEDERDEALMKACLAGFVDRLAARKSPGKKELIMSNGSSAVLSPASVLNEGHLMVALTAGISGAASAHGPPTASAPRGGGSRAGGPPTGGRGRALVNWASRVEPEWLLDVYPERLSEREQCVWAATSERVERVSRVMCGSVTLDESRTAASPSAEASAVLAREAESRGLASFDPEGRLESLLVRANLVGSHRADLDFSPLTGQGAAGVLAQACTGLTSFEQLRAESLETLASAHLQPAIAAALRELAPERVTLRSGFSVAVRYEPSRPPFIEIYLQQFFGQKEGPTLLGGALPLALHLLAPNRRAVQVTTDLPGFWENHYPTIRRELCRRYPKHAWPEDGRTATPPPGGQSRVRRERRR